MPETLSESRKNTLHEEWLSRGTYLEYFGSQDPPVAFKKWRGNPDPCQCGCGEVRYSRSNPLNLWKSLSPQLLWEEKFLIPPFRDLLDFLWSLPELAWTDFRMVFCWRVFRDDALANPMGNGLGWALTPVRILVWSVLSLLFFLLVMASLVMSRFALLVVMPFYVVAMTLFAASLLLSWTLVAVFMALYGLVFLIGGVASILYLSSPEIGIVLLVVGVGAEYESRRRRDRQNREQLGRVLRIVEQKPSDRDVVAESTPWF